MRTKRKEVTDIVMTTVLFIILIILTLRSGTSPLYFWTFVIVVGIVLIVRIYNVVTRKEE
ncbi:hypothetical protein [Priestia megaterium]|uniref:hypothetical protein n=1 Tax=Priestia megaterium TaxID=1404 RepID=UPI001F13EB36|nr:hypothetical protein [Priestia megaterium]UMZ36061.1 hypothetical protein MGJ28_28865 [Priestia megaterium]